MKHRTTIALGICLALGMFLFGIVLAWTIRGVYDREFMMESQFLVVNCTDQPLDITLDFPSGQQHQFTLQPHAQHDFLEINSGEGSITVSIPGRPNESVGYVTTMNGLIILSIDDVNTTFSQLFP